jgi:hypothetical protein
MLGRRMFGAEALYRVTNSELERSQLMGDEIEPARGMHNLRIKFR